MGGHGAKDQQAVLKKMKGLANKKEVFSFSHSTWLLSSFDKLTHLALPTQFPSFIIDVISGKELWLVLSFSFADSPSLLLPSC